MIDRLVMVMGSSELTISDGRTYSGEDEEQGGDELCNVGFDGAKAKGVIKTTKCNSWHFGNIIK